MAHSMTSGMLAQTKAAALCPVFFVDIDTAGGHVYAWSGIGPITWNGQTWLGVGNFGGIDQVGETSDVQASGVNLTLSGIPSDLVEIAINDVRRYLPVKIYIGALDMDNNYAIVPDPYLIRYGRVDTATMTDDGITSSISITVESRMIAMKNSHERRYTDQDQKTERPNDDGMQFVDQIQDVVIYWGQTAV